MGQIAGKASWIRAAANVGEAFRPPAKWWGVATLGEDDHLRTLAGGLKASPTGSSTPDRFRGVA